VKNRRDKCDLCVVVTDAAAGLGWVLSRRLADLGCYVVGIARQTQEVDFPGYLYECDLREAGATEDVLYAIRERFPVDAVVNNLTLSSAQALGEVGLADIYQGVDMSVRVATQVTQGFIESMKARRVGRIVNLCSSASGVAWTPTVQAAALGALAGCTRAWAREMAEYGVTVNAVVAGLIETEALRATVTPGSQAEQHALASVPMRRLGQPAEVVGAVQFLLSAEAGFITGQVLGVDGGESVLR